MNVAANLERSALFFPDNPALSQDGREITYSRLDEESGRVAYSLIEKGIAPGDHVALCAANCPEWIAFYFGVLKAGAVAVTLSSLLSFDELAFLVNHARPRMVFTDRAGELTRLLGPDSASRIIERGSLSAFCGQTKGSIKAVKRDRTDVAAILYTGGTTGVPKGVMLTHENINLSAHNVAFSERSTEKDRALCFLPLNHVFGQMHITNATILSSGCIELMPAFNLDQVLAVLKEKRVTKLFAVPTVYARLLALPDLRERLGAVRYCFSAAASLPAEIIRQWKEATGIDISEGYGMTESASAVTYNHYHRHVAASVGETVPGVEVEIRDLSGRPLRTGQEGEICIRGHNIMKGYLNNPSDTEAAFWPDGWYRSGDVGVLDEKGYLFIVDRLKDMIITGGENVYPREVEEAIYMRPEVQECAVVGIPDKDWGERVVVFIVLKGGGALDVREMKSFLKSRISAFKVPKEYIEVKELPKNAAGKVLKRELRKSATRP
ncbi:MAG: AMP-binding protein [Syntrophorhabdales bacterium]